MREVKFRGKRFDNNHDDWIYGHLHVIDTCGEGYTGKAIQQQFGTSRPYSVRVHDESVGQFTGLKDKNGKEIYEGDVVKGVDFKLQVEYIAVAGWHKRGYWYAFNRENKGISFLNSVELLEIIGNIYENKELLEQ